jgi:hypothetical protein
MHNNYFVYKNAEKIKYGYEENQYEEYHNGVFLYKENVNARYIEQQEHNYKKNLLIEALPPIYSMEQVALRLQNFPYYNDKEREKDSIYRLNAILRIKEFVSVVTKHIEIYQHMALCIRGGYNTKRLGLPIFIKKLIGDTNVINESWSAHMEQNLEIVERNNATPMWGFPIIGISGIGKTTAIDMIMSLFPQCIVHTEYDGHKFLFRQLVWIKIQCASSASIGGICRDFFQEVDKVLKDTDYKRKFGGDRRTEHEMIESMETVVNNHALGTLIIDEIQHLDTSSSIKGLSNLNGEGNAKIQKVMNSLVTIQNKVKVPIIYIGTYKAFNNIFSKSYRQTRRVSGMEDIIWGHMDKGYEWDNFIEEMWTFQFVKNKTPLTDELKECFYQNTMGISDRVVKLFMATQLEAIMLEEEKITIKLINKVSKEKMLLTTRMIDALRRKDENELALLDDIYPKIDIDEMVANAVKDESYIKDLKEIKSSKANKIFLSKKKLTDELIFAMIEIGIDEQEAIKFANEVIQEEGHDKDLGYLKKQVGKKIREANKSSKKYEIADKATAKSRVKKTVKTKEEVSEEIYDDYKKII